MSGQKWHVTVSDGLRGGNVYGFDPTDPPDDVVEGVAKTLWARRKTEEQQRDAGGWPSPFADEYRADARAALRALTDVPPALAVLPR